MPLWKKANIVVIDLETTGLSNEDEIVQIGFVRAKNGVVFHQTEILVNPLRKIDPGASAINGITDDMVRTRSPISKHIRIISKILNCADGIVCHNASFDLRFIRKLEGLEITRKIPYICTMLWARKLGYTGSLSAMAKSCGIEAIEKRYHGALYDAQITYELFCKIVPDHFSTGLFFQGYL